MILKESLQKDIEKSQEIKEQMEAQIFSLRKQLISLKETI